MSGALRRIFTENLSLKLFSLLIAVLVEIYFYSDRVSTTVSTNIVVRNLPPSMMIVSPPGGEKGLITKVKIRGPRGIINNEQSFSRNIEVDLPVPIPKSHRIVLSPSMLNLPRGVELVAFDPETIDLTLDRVVKKELLVVPEREGEPAEGYKLQALNVLPETVIARGPSGELSGLAIIETQSVELDGLNQTQRFEKALVEKGRLTTLNVNVVTVEAVITPIVEEKTLSDVNVKVLAPDGFAATVEPSRVKAVFSGPQTSLREIDSETVKLIADGRLLSSGRHSVTLSAELLNGSLPKGLELVKTIPDRVVLSLHNQAKPQAKAEEQAAGEDLAVSDKASAARPTGRAVIEVKGSAERSAK